MVFVLLTGGEPFLRKDFFEIYEGMRAMGLMITINTNGSLLTGEIRRKLIENPPVRLNISLYGGCDETYRNIKARYVQLEEAFSKTAALLTEEQQNILWAFVLTSDELDLRLLEIACDYIRFEG